MPIKTRGWARIVFAKINMTVSSLLFYKSRLHNPGPHRHGMKLTRSRYNGIRWLACSIWEWDVPSISPERFPSQYMSYRKAAVLLVLCEMTRRKELSIDMLSYRVIFNNNIIQLSGAFYMFKWHSGTPTEINAFIDVFVSSEWRRFETFVTSRGLQCFQECHAVFWLVQVHSFYTTAEWLKLL